MANIPHYSSYQDDARYQEDLSRALTNSLSDNGFEIPQQSSENISTVSSSMNDGTIWYDTDLGKWVGKQDGVLVSFQVTPV